MKRHVSNLGPDLAAQKRIDRHDPSHRDALKWLISLCGCNLFVFLGKFRHDILDQIGRNEYCRKYPEDWARVVLGDDFSSPCPQALSVRSEASLHLND